MNSIITDPPPEALFPLQSAMPWAIRDLDMFIICHLHNEKGSHILPSDGAICIGRSEVETVIEWWATGGKLGLLPRFLDYHNRDSN